MPSAEALRQAGRDVLYYHSRRIYFPKKKTIKDDWIFYGSIAVGVLGLCIANLAPTLGKVLAFSFLVCIGFLCLRQLFYRDNRSRRQDAADASHIYDRAIHLLTHSADIEAIGPLFEILCLPDIPTDVPLALSNILRQLQPEQASLLNGKRRESLIRVLTEPELHTRELQGAIVLAMGNIGDAKALPILEQLVDGALGAADFPELREDARTALFILQERINPGYAGRNLLRASDAPVHTPDELLRPATGSSETPPQELLRAQNGP
jgi:hypothetical protein